MGKVKCYLRGAYGTGNLGDDLLLVSSYNFLREMFSNDEIVVGVHNADFARSLIGDANFHPLTRHVKSDVCFLGGGGQYFSFNNVGGKPGGRIGKLSLLLKQPSLLFYYVQKKISGRWSSRENIAFCIGVGPFEKESDALFRYAKKEIPNFDYISVRDKESKFEISNRFKKVASQFTDPIFDHSRWVPRSHYVSNTKVSGKIGIVLRGWKHSEDKETAMKALARFGDLLKKEGFYPVFFSFHKSDDLEIVNYVQERDMEVFVWDPCSWSLNDFLCEVSSCETIVTSRAHGAIVSGILGVPSVILNIEPKLSNVQKMLALSSSLQEFSLDFDDKSLLAKVEDYHYNNEKYRSLLEKDVEINSFLARKAFCHAAEYLQKKD